MPIKPSVFRPIKANDVHQRPFKSYKSYKISNSTIAANVTQSARYRGDRIDILNSDTGTGLLEMPYPTNPDGTNMHVLWKSLNHRFYKIGNNNDYISEHALSSRTKKQFHLSASTLAIPYNDVGERIKPNTVFIESKLGTLSSYHLHADKFGNLRDYAIQTASFASASNNFFYLSFNNEFQQVNNINTKSDVIQGGAHFSGKNITYSLNGKKETTTVEGNVSLVPGVQTSFISASQYYGEYTSSGFALQYSSASLGHASASYIRIPHDSVFDRMGACDDWTISCWVRFSPSNNNEYNGGAVVTEYFPLFNKQAVIKEKFFNTTTKTMEFRTIVRNEATAPVNATAGNSQLVSQVAGQRFPFAINLARMQASALSTDETEREPVSIRLAVLLGDGSRTTGAVYNLLPWTGSLGNSWNHLTVQNSGSNIFVFANGEQIDHVGADPGLAINLSGFGSTINSADLMIGSPTTTHTGSHGSIRTGQGYEMAEIRMYDYAVNQTGISSLSSNDYFSGSLYQTNIAGNVFNRNGQIVVSSPLPKYNTGSGTFGNDHTYTVKYRGTHQIYENQVMVRVPKDECNVSVNPSSTFTPTTNPNSLDGCANDSKQSNLAPGEFRKRMFMSGSAFPYITTIGLYNEKAQLLAVGKCAQPIQKRSDIDMNFIVRWDY